MRAMNAAAPTPRILPLAVKDLGFRIGEVTVLNGVSLNVAPGTRNIVMGANGAGKSVLLRLLHGLLTPTVGSVRWSQAGDAAIRRAQAMVFQRPVMLRRSVRENVEFALNWRVLPSFATRPGGAGSRRPAAGRPPGAAARQ
jgi:tungstate transport system ATP-binding protein